MVSTVNLQNDNEIEVIKYLLKKTSDLEADCVEVGVYWGYSANEIAKHKGNRKLWLFDTFNGLADADEEERRIEGFFSFERDGHGCYEHLKSLRLPNTEIVRGYFPESGAIIDGKVFSFVHIDVDTFESTKKCLEYFYPRVVRNGVILIHDYFNKGLKVNKAVDSVIPKGEILFTVPETSHVFIWR